jgi:hypothetical protein
MKTLSYLIKVANNTGKRKKKIDYPDPFYLWRIIIINGFLIEIQSHLVCATTSISQFMLTRFIALP